MDTKVILFSQIPLPYSQIGSWTTIYDNYLKQNKNIDILICPVPEEKYSHIYYECFSRNNSLKERIFQKLKLKLPWHQAISALKKVIQPESKYVIHIIDNYGLCIAVANYLEKINARSDFYIQYFYHGYPSFKNELLYSKVDELTLLTYKSYEEIKRNVSALPCRISVLHNGIDTSKFYAIEENKKKILRYEFNCGDKKIFLWCSQDRPKKGLHIILDVWKRIYRTNRNIELWIIGTEKKQNIEGIKYIGKVPNKVLGKYYQVSDVFLFPTLCHEGFPLSLTEAIHSGCYCIASNLGGVSEVLENGKYGKLIENPHFTSEWITAIEEYLKGNYTNVAFPKSLYTSEEWNEKMNSLIKNAKENLE